MNLITETIFRIESKFYISDFEVDYQELNKGVGTEDIENGEREILNLL